MKLKSWLKKYNGAPADLEEVGYLARRVEDDAELREAADRYVDAKEKFEVELARVGYEFG